MNEEQIMNRYVRGWISLNEFREEMVRFYEREDRKDLVDRIVAEAYIKRGKDRGDPIRNLVETAVKLALAQGARDVLATYEEALEDRGSEPPAFLAELNLVFKDEGGPSNLRFVEIETPDGKSVSAGTWTKQGDYDILKLSVHPSDIQWRVET